MDEDDRGLICAYLRSPDGGWTPVGWPEVEGWSRQDGALWVHLDGTGPRAHDFVRRSSGVDILVQDALLADGTRPRSVSMGEGLLATLRGVNLNPGADPEDMVSLRMWIEPERIFTVRRRKLMAVQDIRDQIGAGRGPVSVPDLFVQLTARLIDRMADVIEGLDEEEDRLEAEMVDAPSREVRAGLAGVRRQAIELRRYLAPQREALSRLQSEELGWLDERGKARLREITDRVVRYVEDLDSVRERAAVMQDEVMNRMSEQMNRNMYLLTIVATVMLPLGFVTGLLGINVDGIPGADTPWAFAGVCTGLVVLVAAELWLLKRLRWF